MKELDRAIINNDIERITFLLGQGVDCKGAVLMHLKDVLIPKHFTAKALQSRGAILTVEGLKSSIATFLKGSSYDFRNETYIKRVYLSLQKALQAWQLGAVANQDLASDWNKQAIDYLQNQWAENALPQGITDYVVERQEAYIDFKYQQWHNQTLDDVESQTLDGIVHGALSGYWFQNADRNEIVIKQIADNILDQTVEFYQNEPSDKPFVKAIGEFLRKQVIDQIYSGTINNVAIGSMIEQGKNQVLKGIITSDTMPAYKKSVDILFSQWQRGKLDASDSSDVTRYITKQLTGHRIPGKLKTRLIENAINQLLAQYKHRALSPEVSARLESQFAGNIDGYYETKISKETVFRAELSEVVFLELLNDWTNQELNPAEADYLQTHLLSEVQDVLRDLSHKVSRSAQATQIKVLQDMVFALQEQLSDSKTQTTPVEVEEKEEESEEVTEKQDGELDAEWCSIKHSAKTLPRTSLFGRTSSRQTSSDENQDLEQEEPNTTVSQGQGQ